MLLVSSRNFEDMVSLLLPLLLWLHPLHISVTEVDYNEKVKALQLTSRIFIDDLELAIRSSLGKPDLDLLDPGNGQTTDALVKKYLEEMIQIRVDKKLVSVRYLGHEIEGPAMICYIEGENVKKMATIEITNRVILETHNDQSNLVNVNFNDKVKSLRLTVANPTGQLSFSDK